MINKVHQYSKILKINNIFQLMKLKMCYLHNYRIWMTVKNTNNQFLKNLITQYKKLR